MLLLEAAMIAPSGEGRMAMVSICRPHPEPRSADASTAATMGSFMRLRCWGVAGCARSAMGGKRTLPQTTLVTHCEALDRSVYREARDVMAGAIVFWSFAVGYGLFSVNAQRTGEMFLPRGKNVIPTPDQDPGQTAAPQRLLREDDPKAFHDAMVFRWWIVGAFMIAGAGFAVAQWLGISR